MIMRSWSLATGPLLIFGGIAAVATARAFFFGNYERLYKQQPKPKDNSSTK